MKIQITYEEFDVLLKEILSLIFYYAEVNTHQMKAENIEIKSFTTSAIPFVNKAEKLLSNYEDNQRNPFLSFLSPPSDVHLNFFEPPRSLPLLLLPLLLFYSYLYHHLFLLIYVYYYYSYFYLYFIITKLFFLLFYYYVNYFNYNNKLLSRET